MWSIVMLKEEEETDHTLFNWELCRMRYELHIKEKDLFKIDNLKKTK